jgi:hypothetical protein
VNVPSLLAVLVVVVGVPLNLYVTRKLWGLSRSKPEVRVLRERALVSAVVLLIVAVFGLIFLNNDTVPPILGLDVTKIVTRLAIVVLAFVPAAYWLILYRGR